MEVEGDDGRPLVMRAKEVEGNWVEHVAGPIAVKGKRCQSMLSFFFELCKTAGVSAL